MVSGLLCYLCFAENWEKKKVRWPLFTFPYALVSYAKSVGKPVVVALTKTDLVAPEVALAWEDYFGKVFPELSVAKTNAFPVVQADGGQRVKAKKDQRVKVRKKKKKKKKKKSKQIFRKRL